MYTITIPVKITIIAKPKEGEKANYPDDFERLARQGGTFIGRHDGTTIVLIFETTTCNDAGNVGGLARAEAKGI
jgi:hypothetical protein